MAPTLADKVSSYYLTMGAHGGLILGLPSTDNYDSLPKIGGKTY